MANTTKLEDRWLEIKGLDADWSVAGDLGADFLKSGLRVRSITFHPSAANDEMVIKQAKASHTTTALAIATTATAPRVFTAKAAGVQAVTQEYGPRGRQMRPFIDISDCTLNTAANARVEFELA